MNSLSLRNIKQNKFMYLIALLLFSLMSLYMPHGLVETYVHHDYENSAKLLINKEKKLDNKKLLNKLKFLLYKIFKLASRLVNMIILKNVRSVLLTMRFFEVSIVKLFSFLYFYFQGSKYKARINTPICYY